MHLVVNMAEHVSESLKLFEQAHPTDTVSHLMIAAQSGLSEPLARPLKRGEMRNLAIPFSSTLN